MTISTSINSIKQWPPVLALRKRRYEKKFANQPDICRGVFDSFEAALATAPDTKVKGFDVPEFEGFYDHRRNKLFLYDYPILFWLDRILNDNSRVFDIGGNTGVHFMGYRSHLRAWEKVRWEICEVPIVVDAGKKFAKREGYENRLFFTDDIFAADGADILLSLGTLQYIEQPTLPDLLASLKDGPEHLLLGKLPLYDGESYVTLQNGGPHFIAQRIFNRSEFLGALTELGYEIVDEWQDSSRSCIVPFHPGYSVQAYTGLYLARR